MSAELNCFEAIHELDAALSGVVPDGMNYLLLGGIASSALRHSSTHYETLPIGGVIDAPNGAAESVMRPNGTRRDIDILITGTLDEEKTKNIKSTIADATDGKLVVSVFDFDTYNPNYSLFKKTKAGVSKRTIDEVGTYRYELFPLEQVVSAESYEPWYLMTPAGLKVNVLHPVGHVLAYRMRSISGLRTKDEAKVTEMTHNVMNSPEMQEALYDGPFLDWLAFAEAIPRILNKKIDLNDGMLKQDTSKAALAAFRWKGKLLHVFESNDLIVKLAQDEDGLLEKALNFFVHAK